MLCIRSVTEKRLEQWLKSNVVGDFSIYFYNILGFLTATVICPIELTRKIIVEVVLDEAQLLTHNNISILNKIFIDIQDEIDRSFNAEESCTLPAECVLNEKESKVRLESWCVGFMEAHFLSEESWFQHHEQEVCELLLPIMLGSGLFDDEPDFIELLKKPQLTKELWSQIPEVLVELYLMFHSSYTD